MICSFFHDRFKKLFTKNSRHSDFTGQFLRCCAAGRPADLPEFGHLPGANQRHGPKGWWTSAADGHHEMDRFGMRPGLPLMLK